MGEYENIRIDVTAPIATLTISREERLNALNAATVSELTDAVAALDANEDVRGVVVTGSGDRAFVAGADIAELARMTPLTGASLSQRGQRLMRAIELSDKPYVAALNGFALGGGCELALACHFRIASTNARFGLPEVKLGVIPGYGGTVRLPRIIGKGRALEMILTGEMIDAAEAHRIGLVNRVTEPGSLIEEARNLLETILANGPLAVAMAIESVTRGLEVDLDDASAFEANLFARLAGTDDMREGMAAFLEKRSATFEGR